MLGAVDITGLVSTKDLLQRRWLHYTGIRRTCSHSPQGPSTLAPGNNLMLPVGWWGEVSALTQRIESTVTGQEGLSDDLTKVHSWGLLICFKSGCSCCVISRP